MRPSSRTVLLCLALLLTGDLHAGWKKLFGTSTVSCFVVFDSVIVVGSDSGCFRSLDCGASWSFHEVDRLLTSPQTETPLGVASLCRNDQYLFAATGAGVYASSDTGRTWHPLGPAPDGRRLLFINVYAHDSIVLCTMAGGGLFRSTDNGAGWWYLGPHRQYSYFSLGASLFAAAMDGIWCSRDLGSTWAQCPEFPSYRMVLCLTGNADYMFADAFDLLYRSSDAGESWQALDTGVPFGGHHLEGVFATDSLLFAGLSEHLVYLSRDNGQHWIDISAGLDTVDAVGHLNQFGRSGKQVLSNKDGSLWSYDLSQVTTVRAVHADGPESFGLWQNYPNPFNPRTEVRSQMSEARHVRLVVYDLLGREVAVLVDEQRAAGSYRDTFDGSGLASGMYIYRVSAGAFVQSRTMVLLK